MRSLVLALLLLAASATPAWAGGTLLPDSESHVRWGPLFAGERLAWATPDAEPDGYRIHMANVDGSGHSTREIEAPISRFGTTDWFSFAASDRRLVASLHLIHCLPACKYQNYEFPFSKVLSAGGDDPFEPFGVPCTSAYLSWSGVAVDGDAAAYLTCNEVVVHDLGAAEGEPREFRYPEASRVRLAGPYVASLETGRAGAIVVREWRTGVERLRIPEAGASHDVGPDATVAFVADGRLQVASPSAPEPRVLAEGARGGVELAGERVAYTLDAGGVAVRGLDGSLVAQSPTAGLGDFDGGRVAWVDRTCARTAIATWDLRGEAPALPRANPCPLASLRSSVLRARSGSFGSASVRVKLACAAEPPVGCSGEVTLFAKDSRRKYAGRLVDMTYGAYHLAPGERTTLELGYLKRRVCIAGRNGLRPIVQISSWPFDEGNDRRTKTRRVRVVGLDKAMADCAA